MATIFAPHGAQPRLRGQPRRITERDLDTWPVGRQFAVRAHTQRITLTVILRAVFGVRDEERMRRAMRLVDEFAAALTPQHAATLENAPEVAEIRSLVRPSTPAA